MRYKGIFFDLDGTLLDTLGDLAAGVNHVLSTMGYPIRTKEEIRSFIGDGFAMLLKRSCPPNTPDFDMEKAFDEFVNYCSEHLFDTTRPYGGITELVDELFDMGIPMAVVSNKRDEPVKRLIDHFFGEKIKIALGERGGNTRKPSPVLCLEAAQLLGLDPSEVLYVGDSPSDVQTAINAGMVPVAVSWGFRSHSELISGGAPLVVHSVLQLRNVIFSE